MYILAIEFAGGIEDAWSSIASFVPKLLGFLVILVIGYIIAKVISKIANKALDKVGLDQAVERGGVKKVMARTEWDPSDIVGKIIFYALMLIVLQLAFGVFGTNPVSDLIEGIIAYLPKVFAAIIILIVAAAVAAVVKEVIEASLGGLSYGKGLAAGASTAIIIVGIFAALDQLNIAPQIVTGLFYAMLAIVVGVAVIAVGGGGIKAMQGRWENVMATYDEEKPRVAEERKGAQERIKARAQERKQQAQQTAPSNSSGDGRKAQKQQQGASAPR